MDIDLEARPFDKILFRAGDVLTIDDDPNKISNFCYVSTSCDFRVWKSFILEVNVLGAVLIA